MKKITLLTALLMLLISSCIDDKGNYDYTSPDVPVVILDDNYFATIGVPLVIVPTVRYNGNSSLSYDWSISDPDQMTTHIYTGEELNTIFNLRARTYSAILTVTENTTGMKYFYNFTITGQTEFSQGIVLLTSVNGASELSFIKPDGTVQKDIYQTLNGESLPDGPKQLVSIYHKYMMGGLYLGYWIICSDPDTGGVLVGPDDLLKVRTLRENFTSAPEEINVGTIISIDDNGTMTGTVNKEVHLGSFEGYYLWDGYNFFSTPILGNYAIDNYVKDKTAGFFWGYDSERKNLAAFMATARMKFEVTSTGGTWDPLNLDIELLAMDFHASGGYIIGRETDGKTYQYSFMTGGSMVINPTKTEFEHAALLREDTKWLLSNGGVFFFTSGNKVYRYNPLVPSDVEQLVANIEGDVTMLKFGTGEVQNELVVGSEGRLYWLSLTGSAGNDGHITATQTGFDGKPVDMYHRINPE